MLTDPQTRRPYASFRRPLEISGVYTWFLVFLFLVPTFRGPLHVGGSYYGEMIQAAYTGGFLVLLLALMAHRRLHKNLLVAPLYICFAFCLLVCAAMLRDAHHMVPSDTLELYKPILALLIFTSSVLIRWDEDSVEKVFTAYLVICGLMATYSIFEALGGTTINSIASILYKDNKDVLTGKATGTFGVTYSFGAFMIFGCILSLSSFLYRKHITSLFIFFFCTTSVILSQSRSSAIAMLFLVVALFLTYWLYNNFKHKIVFYVGYITMVIVVIIALNSLLSVFDKLPYLYEGIKYLLEHGVSAQGGGSFNQRYQQILFAFREQSDFPLIGAGIGKGYARLLESYYALYLYRFGLVGISISIVIFISFFYISLRAFNRSFKAGNLKGACFFLSLHFWMYAFPIISLSSSLHDQGKFSVFFYGSFGIMISYVYRENLRNEYQSRVTKYKLEEEYI